LHKGRREPRFADSGLACDQDHLAFTCLCPSPASQQQFGLFLPPHEGGQATRVQRLEAALDGPRPQHCPSPRSPGDALEVLWPEVFKLKETTEKPSGAFADNDRIRRRDPLQTSRQIRRFAHDPTFLRLPGADKITDHGQARRESLLLLRS